MNAHARAQAAATLQVSSIFMSFAHTDAVPTTIHLFYFYRCNNADIYTAILPKKNYISTATIAAGLQP